MLLDIRESAARNLDSICALHESAFGESEGHIIAALVKDLIKHPTAKPMLSLIAEQDSQIVGHVLFSPVAVSHEDCGGYILAPLAVATDFQGNGIGKALINQGCDELVDRGARFVLVLGDPRYYSQAGFTADHNIESPFPLEYPEAWMARELDGEALKRTAGTVSCVDPLMHPKHW